MPRLVIWSNKDKERRLTYDYCTFVQTRIHKMLHKCMQEPYDLVRIQRYELQCEKMYIQTYMPRKDESICASAQSMSCPSEETSPLLLPKDRPAKMRSLVEVSVCHTCPKVPFLR